MRTSKFNLNFKEHNYLKFEKHHKKYRKQKCKSQNCMFRVEQRIMAKTDYKYENYEVNKFIKNKIYK